MIIVYKRLIDFIHFPMETCQMETCHMETCQMETCQMETCPNHGFRKILKISPENYQIINISFYFKVITHILVIYCNAPFRGTLIAQALIECLSNLLNKTKQLKKCKFFIPLFIIWTIYHTSSIQSRLRLISVERLLTL